MKKPFLLLGLFFLLTISLVSAGKTVLVPILQTVYNGSTTGSGNVSSSALTNYIPMMTNNTNIENSPLYIIKSVNSRSLIGNSTNITDFYMYGQSEYKTTGQSVAVRSRYVDQFTGDYWNFAFRTANNSGIGYTEMIQSVYDKSQGVTGTFEEYFTMTIDTNNFTRLQFGRGTQIESVSIGPSGSNPTNRRGLNVYSNTSFYDFVGIGATSPENPLEVWGDYAKSGSSNVFGLRFFRTHISGPVIRLYKANGNSTDSRRVSAGDTLGGMNVFGYENETGTGNATIGNVAGQFQFVAQETFNSTNHGTYWKISLAPNGSATVQERIRLTGEGYLGIGVTNPVYPLQVGTNVSGISIFSQANISATGFNTRTSVYNKIKGRVLARIKDADQLKYANGSINHSAFIGYAGKINVTDYTKPVTVLTEIEIGEFVNVTSYPYTVEVEQVSLDEEVNALRQAVYDIKDCADKRSTYAGFRLCLLLSGSY